MARLKEQYASEFAPALMKKFGYTSVMQIPKLDKVVINVGCGEARDNPKIIDAIVSDLSKITGQRPVVCKAKKVRRELQAARGNEYRRKGDAARRAHV